MFFYRKVTDALYYIMDEKNNMYDTASNLCEAQYKVTSFSKNLQNSVNSKYNTKHILFNDARANALMRKIENIYKRYKNEDSTLYINTIKNDAKALASFLEACMREANVYYACKHANQIFDALFYNTFLQQYTQYEDSNKNINYWRCALECIYIIAYIDIGYLNKFNKLLPTAHFQTNGR